ncbi:hypothetical protein [Mycobacterium pseudoshottsii]|uniref:Uncharacterized protein n=2 Tax=Mycobacteriaceae TaxID=1762 RepID=A0A9N7QQ67_9MYCO|nr:hypothetical protein [Mycobacterium pseudoshottsii]BBA88942.1 hypothetical protein MPSD_35240 [Mycobacterium pseudoshottsii JCM 15466]BDN83244.1 hypothetical protein NJB1907Z4_C34590 [Mycobacterium pseudoshottsii]
MAARWFDKRRVLAAWALGCVVLSLLTAPAVKAVPNTQCTLTTSVQEVHSMRELPPALLQMLPPIADVGEPFNSTDSVEDPALPFRRLIRAGHRDVDWFVWYEHGGLGYFWQAVVAHVESGAPISTLANAGTVSDLLCALTDAVFAGKVPPYPPGTWAAFGY